MALEAEEKNNNTEDSAQISDVSQEKKDSTIYINLKALDKITAKTSTFKLTLGEKKIKNLKNARDHLDSLGIFQGAGGFLLKSKLDQRNLRRTHNQTN